MRKLYDVTVWDGSKLICTAENIVAASDREAVENGVRAVAARRSRRVNARIVDLYHHIVNPWKQPNPPDGIRVFVAEKERGVKVIG